MFANEAWKNIHLLSDLKRNLLKKYFQASQIFPNPHQY